MNFEEIESVWSQQATPPPASAKTTLSVRGRLLGYQLGLLAFTLVVYPVLSVANFRFLHPVSPVMFWGNVGFHEVLFLGLLAYTVRRIRRHRRLRRESTATLLDYNTALLRATEAEIRDTRMSLWLVPLFVGLALLSGYENNAAAYTWRLFATHVGVLAAITIPILGAAWGRYFTTLKPDQARLRDLLGEMEGEREGE